MAPGSSFRGRGGMRGRGRGRGRGGPRGRGRGRGGFSRFDSSRVAEKEDAENEVQAPLESESEESTEESASEPETETKAREAYLSLMKSFESRSADPAAKRRKLAHSGADTEDSGAVQAGTEQAEEEEEEEEGDDDNDDDDDEEESEEDDEDEDEDEDQVKDGENEDNVGKDVDYVEEEEDAEGMAGEVDDGLDDEDDEDDEQVDATDPFEAHFAAPDAADVARRLEAIQSEAWLTAKANMAGARALFTVPRTDGDAAAASSAFSPPAPVTGPQQLKLKKRLADNLAAAHKTAFTDDEQKLAPALFNYYDTLFCERTPANGDDLRRLASLHAVNHVFKTRDRVLKNNEKLAKAARKAQDGGGGGVGGGGPALLLDDDDGDAYRDQGFHRPKVLMLLPTRQSCARMVEAICAVCQPEQQENRKRFDEAYVDRSATVPADRPADFRDLFDGNDDDMFRLGLKFTRKTVKFFAQFYNADIILASPLGLRMAMGSEDRLATSLAAAAKKKKSKPQTDVDFLSSVEIVLLDQADALLMQNWEHVEHIFRHLNRLPRDPSHSHYDITRLRSWYLDEQAAFYRQTVVLSAFHTPALGELLRRFGRNWAGKVRLQPPAYPGVVGRLGVRRVKQTFSRFEPASIEAEPDARFDYFVKAVVPAVVAKASASSASSSSSATAGRPLGSGVLVFIPSYLDFVRVRNWFATAAAVAHVSFGAVSEYATVAEASRALSHFLTGRHRVLLYTERAHHFRRHQINGARTVVLYGLPENPVFYAEITGGYLARSLRSQRLEPGQGAVRALFSPYDAFKLERIVGSQRVGRMLRERSDTFVFEEEQAF